MKKKTYEPMPEIPEELQARYQVILAVLAGKLSVSEAARQLDLSRNHFQTVMHRALSGLIEGLAPRPTGRPPTPKDEEKERLHKENARLRDRVETIDRLMEVAGGILRGQVKLTGRMREPRAKEKPGGDENDEDDPTRRLDAAQALRRLGLTMVLAAALVGASCATLRRWRARVRDGQPGVRARGPAVGARRALPEVEQRVEAVVRETRGLLGADALRHRVPDVSRRRAAAIKRATVTAMEHERKAACTRVTVTVPGVLRGFDQLFVGDRTVLVSGDGCVPYRTSSHVVKRYDGAAVAEALERDWTQNGAPLVERLDRARAHQVDQVVALAARYGVLLLHGPPRYPQFYGQLERQNREHRAWLRTLPDLDPDALGHACDQMRLALNHAWPRRSLHWRTAHDVWTHRPPITPAERLALRHDVADRTPRIARHLRDRGQPTDLAERFAIEQALANCGLVRREVGGWC
jgi:transposase-like protein